MCKVFPITLIGPAQARFNSLEPKSVRNFVDLAKLFISRFIVRVPAKKKTSYLETIKQRRNKSLRLYVAIFNSEALQIPKLHEVRAVLQKGTTFQEFFESLCRRPPSTLLKLMKRAEKYIRQDDAFNHQLIRTRR